MDPLQSPSLAWKMTFFTSTSFLGLLSLLLHKLPFWTSFPPLQRLVHHSLLTCPSLVPLSVRNATSPIRFTSSSLSNPSLTSFSVLSSGDWQTNGGYSITEAPRRPGTAPASLLKPSFVSSAGPTVPHPGRTVAHQTPLFVNHATSALATTQGRLRQNLTRLLFKSLEELFHSYVR